ncbi:MAG: ATP-binding cassette domain-containing protein [Oscillospiraceae bacterium]
MRDVSRAVARGRCVCIMGGNAQGKTTLLSIAAGLVTPDDGLVRCDGALKLRIAGGACAP